MIVGPIIPASISAVAAKPVVQASDATQAFENLMADCQMADGAAVMPIVQPAVASPIAPDIAPVSSGDSAYIPPPLPANIAPQTSAAKGMISVPFEDGDEAEGADEVDLLPVIERELRARIDAPAFIAAAPIPSRSMATPSPPRAIAAQEVTIATKVETKKVETKPTILPPEARDLSTAPAQPAVAISQPPLTTQAVVAANIAPTANLDLARDPLWLDQLAREIVAVASHDGKLRFSLSPQALGNLEVAISTDHGGVHIELQTSTESAARIFAAEQPKLAEELRQSGIRLVSNDMMSGQQMSNQRDQSQMQNFIRQVPLRTSGLPLFEPVANTAIATQHSGRFA
jgi:hypothetical protein